MLKAKVSILIFTILLFVVWFILYMSFYYVPSGNRYYYAGKVVDQANKAIADVRVDLYFQEEIQSLNTNEDGMFRLETNDANLIKFKMTKNDYTFEHDERSLSASPVSSPEPLNVISAVKRKE